MEETRPKIDAARVAELRARHDRFTLAEAACHGLVPGSVPMDLISALPTLLDEIERVNAWLAAGHEVIERCSPEALAAKDMRIAYLERERDNLVAWRDDAVRSCAKRGCATRDRRLRDESERADEAENRVAELERERDETRGAVTARATMCPSVREGSRSTEAMRCTLEDGHDGWCVSGAYHWTAPVPLPDAAGECVS